MFANEAVKVSRLFSLRGIPPPENAQLCVKNKKIFREKMEKGKNHNITCDLLIM